MPTNRTKRTRKRVEITDMKMHELFYGPGTSHFPGEGYLPLGAPQFWRDVSSTEREAILAQMRADWRASHDLVRKAWADRSEHELWCADRHHGNPAEPWALETFGEPR